MCFNPGVMGEELIEFRSIGGSGFRFAIEMKFKIEFFAQWCQSLNEPVLVFMQADSSQTDEPKRDSVFLGREEVKMEKFFIDSIGNNPSLGG